MRYVSHDIEAGLQGAFDLRSGDNIGKPPPQPPHLDCTGTVVHAPDSAHIVLNSSSDPEAMSIHEDEEDGWVSDQSSPRSGPLEKEHRQSAKSASNRASKKRRIDRHRSSIHIHHHSHLPPPTPRGLSTSESGAVPAASLSAPAPDVPSLPVAEALASPMDTMDAEPRGRAPAAFAPSAIATRRRPRHMRIVSLRGSETGSREVSPARSVRWADTGAGPSSATARWPQSPSAQGSRAPSPGPPTPGEPTEGDLG